jgi:hypothetical protein
MTLIAFENSIVGVIAAHLIPDVQAQRRVDFVCLGVLLCLVVALHVWLSWRVHQANVLAMKRFPELPPLRGGNHLSEVAGGIRLSPSKRLSSSGSLRPSSVGSYQGELAQSKNGRSLPFWSVRKKRKKGTRGDAQTASVDVAMQPYAA